MTAGQRLVGDEKTPLDPKELLDIKGIRETQQYLVDEVQRVYREQGVSIHDKHVELIVRQMLKRVAVSEPGDSEFLPGEKVDSRTYADTNRALVEEGKQPAEGRPELMGITKASLATDSWLSAASFQETTRVLTEAAIEGKSDQLLGLKENVIIGKLIPAGTGMLRYRSIETKAPEAQPLPFYSSDTDQDLADWLRSLGEGSSEARGEGDVVDFGAPGAHLGRHGHRRVGVSYSGTGCSHTGGTPPRSAGRRRPGSGPAARPGRRARQGRRPARGAVRRRRPCGRRGPAHPAPRPARPPWPPAPGPGRGPRRCGP